VTERGSDPRVARTRTKLREALLAECAERPLEDVGVTAVTGRALLSRATFYLHYPDLQALAVDACAEIVRDAVEALHAWRGIPDPARPPAALVDFFAAVPRYAGLYRTLLRPGGCGPLGELLQRELRERSRTERVLAEAPHPELLASAIASAFTGLLADWLHELVPGTPELVAGQTWRLLLTLHQAELP
jgi:AcrR family transcriptional regulator